MDLAPLGVMAALEKLVAFEGPRIGRHDFGPVPDAICGCEKECRSMRKILPEVCVNVMPNSARVDRRNY